MLEVLNYLRANGFKTFIVSGGGVEFMRPWTERVYGVPPEQVVGSRAKVQYEVKDGIRRCSASRPSTSSTTRPANPWAFIRSSAGARSRRSAIQTAISRCWNGRRPAAGPRFGLIVHHTDAAREWAYDRTSHIGTLARGLDEAGKRGWTVVDMRQDWKVIYPFVGEVVPPRSAPMAMRCSSVRRNSRPSEIAGDASMRSPTSLRATTCGVRPPLSTTVSPSSLTK